MNQSSLIHAKKHPHAQWAKMITRSIELSFLSNSDWSLNLEKIQEAARHGPLVLDCSTDPFNGHEKIVKKQLKDLIDDFYILTGDTNYLDDSDGTILYYPTFFVETIEFPPHDRSVLTGHRNYFLGCLNGRSRIHRIENYIKLKKKKFMKDCIFTIHRQFDYEVEKKESQDDFCDRSILIDYFEAQKSLPQRTDKNDLTSTHSAYTDCFINLVTETSVSDNQVFLSEKTFKPFTTGQFALWVSSAGTVARLRKFGFDMFDDVIDHGYDKEPNWHRRIDMIHNELDRLYSMDISSIFQNCTERRVRNFDRLYSDELHKIMFSQVNKEFA